MAFKIDDFSPEYKRQILAGGKKYIPHKRPRIDVAKIHDGNTVYDSKLEMDRHRELQLLEQAGAITKLQLKPRLHLSEAEITYTPDYGYVQDGRQVYEDAKGFETERFRIIKRLWRIYGPGLLRITKRSKGGAIRTAQEIMGEGKVGL